LVKEALKKNEVNIDLNWNFGPLFAKAGFSPCEVIPPKPLYVRRTKVKGVIQYHFCEKGEHLYTVYDCGYKIWRKTFKRTLF